MKPVIGVMPLWDDEKNSLWMLPGYLDGISRAGGLPVIFPFTSDERELEQLAGRCDGFLFTGGQDVSPELYHEPPMEGLVVTCPKRDAMEHVVLRMALERDMPVLGICRGLQFINAFLGGSLYQDIPTQHPSETEHRQAPPYDKPSHAVMIEKGSPLHHCLGVDALPVNSCHHQAIKQLAPALKAMAFSPDGLVEAAYLPEKRFLWAVQWHPEFSCQTSPHSRAIFHAFAEAMLQLLKLCYQADKKTFLI